jgi:hypothetical protein
MHFVRCRADALSMHEHTEAACSQCPSSDHWLLSVQYQHHVETMDPESMPILPLATAGFQLSSIVLTIFLSLALNLRMYMDAPDPN